MAVWKRLGERRGAVAIMIGVATVVFLSLTALAIDIGFGLVTKNELHNVADAAALAGTRQLGKIYEGLSVDARQTYVLNDTDRATIVTAIQTVAGQNRAAGVAISIDAADIRIGQWNTTSRTLTVTNNQPDAVEITARRDATANGPIATFFARIMGIDSLNVLSSSQRVGGAWTGVEQPTAALTGPSHVFGGEVTIPVALSQSRFASGEDGFCGHVIKFAPPTDPEACGGWTTLTDPSNVTDSRFRDMLNGLNDGTYQSPELYVDNQIYVKNGVLSNQTFAALQALYDAKKAADGTWKTFVPVYDSDTCHPTPSDTLHVKGFATVLITSVTGAPAKEITGTIECKTYEPARGGGAPFGTKGSIPGLVK
jgi:Flp pilus assembly protein TadG